MMSLGAFDRADLGQGVGPAFRARRRSGRVTEIQFATMETVRNIEIEAIAAGLAGLVLVQLALELRAIFRRARRASRDGAFFQVQARRLPGAVARNWPRRPAEKGRTD